MSKILIDQALLKYLILLTPLVIPLGAVLVGYLINQLRPVPQSTQAKKVGRIIIAIFELTVSVYCWSVVLDECKGKQPEECSGNVGSFAVTACVLLVLCIHEVFQLFQDSQPLANDPSRDAARNLRQRKTLMDKVRVQWIRNGLDRSLYKTVPLKLNLKLRTDLVNVQIQKSGQEPQALPPGRRIFEEFEELGGGGTLLILGDPGSGKTTLLQELAHDFLTCTDPQNLEKPVPVVLSLSSWGKLHIGRRRIRNLEDWLIQEINTHYQIQPATSKAWLKTDSLVLLLDGLDEVQRNYRDECVKAINAFQDKYGVIRIAVCSRLADYESLKRSLHRFGEAVLIQPLSREQIENYLHEVGDLLSGLRIVLQANEGRQELWELLSKPVCLWVASLALQNVGENTLSNNLQPNPVTLLLDRYVEQMFIQRSNSPKAQYRIKRWLSSLAKKMEVEGEKGFFIEKMQPEQWLSGSFHWLQYRMLSGLLFGLAGALISALFVVPLTGINDGWLFGLFAAWIVFGLLVELSNVEISRIVLVEAIRVASLQLVLQKIIRNYWRTRIKHKKLRGEMLFALILGVVSGVIHFRKTGLFSEMINTFLVGLLSGMVGVILLGLVYGLIFELKADSDIYSYPNQGIRKSLCNMIKIGFLTLISTSALYGLLSLFTLITPVNPLIKDGVGVMNALFVSGALLAGGGQACIEHFSLRLVLHFAGLFPLHCVAFLKDAEERLFIKREGGRYDFIDRSLQDYFFRKDFR